MHCANAWRKSITFVWNAEAGQEFADKCEALLAHYSWLAKDSMKQGKCMFSIVQKHHLFAHYPSQCRYLAPRGCWAYGGESFMSLMVAIASGSVKSTPAWMLPSKVLNKFQFAFHLALKGISKDGRRSRRQRMKKAGQHLYCVLHFG